MYKRYLENYSLRPLYYHAGLMDLLYGLHHRSSSVHGVRSLTGQIMNALKFVTKCVKDKVLGDSFQDWGVVYLKEGRFAIERLKLALYKKKEKSSLILNITYKKMLGPNTCLIVFSDVNLPDYVEKPESNYAEFCKMPDTLPKGSRNNNSLNLGRRSIPSGGVAKT